MEIHDSTSCASQTTVSIDVNEEIFQQIVI